MKEPPARTWPSALRPLGVSLALTLALGALVKRALQQAEIELDLVFFGGMTDFRVLEWSIVAAVLAAAAVALGRCRAADLIRIQAWSLVVCFFLTQYRLGAEPGTKIDLRLALCLISGIVGLYCCYICLFAQLVLGLWALFRHARTTPV